MYAAWSCQPYTRRNPRRSYSKRRLPMANSKPCCLMTGATLSSGVAPAAMWAGMVMLSIASEGSNGLTGAGEKLTLMPSSPSRVRICASLPAKATSFSRNVLSRLTMALRAIWISPMRAPVISPWCVTHSPPPTFDQRIQRLRMCGTLHKHAVHFRDAPQMPAV